MAGDYPLVVRSWALPSADDRSGRAAAAYRRIQPTFPPERPTSAKSQVELAVFDRGEERLPGRGAELQHRAVSMLLGVTDADREVRGRDLDATTAAVAVGGLVPGGGGGDLNAALATVTVARFAPAGELVVVHDGCSSIRERGEYRDRLLVGQLGGGLGEQGEAAGLGQGGVAEAGVELFVGRDLGGFGEDQIRGDGVDGDDGGVAGVGIGVD